MQRKLERLEAERQKLLEEQQAWSAEKVEAAQQLAAMDAKLADALRRNNAEWRARMDEVREEADAKVAQVGAWHSELEKLRSEASQIRALIEQVRSRSNSPSAGAGRSPGLGKENGRGVKVAPIRV